MSEDLKAYYSRLGIHEFEGHSQQDSGETEFLSKIIQNDMLVNVIEIGFNAGHSADTFLRNNSKIHLTSFDLGEHHYVKLGKSYIDEKYPNRHTLILGDSCVTIPEFIKANKASDKMIKYDLIFIDGGHYHHIPESDLKNCRQLAHKDTIVIMDDTKTTDIKGWNVTVNYAWNKYKTCNYVAERESFDFSPTHGLSYGKYNFCEMYVLSLLKDDRKHILDVNKSRFPNLNIVKSINGYNKIETLEELNAIGLPYKHLDFRTYGTLANWITKYKMLIHQIDNSIPYMCFIEDDVELYEEFEHFINDAIQYLKDDVNMIRLLEWGEVYITSLESAKRIVEKMKVDGIIDSIDNQLRKYCGREYGLGGAPIKLCCPTNEGDCNKTDGFDFLPTLEQLKII